MGGRGAFLWRRHGALDIRRAEPREAAKWRPHEDASRENCVESAKPDCAGASGHASGRASGERPRAIRLMWAINASSWHIDRRNVLHGKNVG